MPLSLSFPSFSPISPSFFSTLPWLLSLFISRRCQYLRLYRVIQEELQPLTELISDDNLSKKCHINLGPILNIYRVTFHEWLYSTIPLSTLECFPKFSSQYFWKERLLVAPVIAGIASNFTFHTRSSSLNKSLQFFIFSALLVGTFLSDTKEALMIKLYLFRF
jgi:hypothetical protein